MLTEERLHEILESHERMILIGADWIAVKAIPELVAEVRRLNELTAIQDKTINIAIDYLTNQLKRLVEKPAKEVRDEN